MDPGSVATAGTVVVVVDDGATGSVVSIIVASSVKEGLTSGTDFKTSVGAALVGEVGGDAACGGDDGDDDGSCLDNFPPPDSDGFFERPRRTWYLLKNSFPMLAGCLHSHELQYSPDMK